VPPPLGHLAAGLTGPETAPLAGRVFTSHEVTAQRAAVLVLLTPDDPPALLLTERAAGLRHHAGQVSFPGGGIEAGETPADAALREAHEEVGLAPSAVTLLGELPPARIAVSRFAVRSVVAWWDGRSPLVPAHDEVASAHLVPVTALADPAARFTWTHPSGITGPGFAVGELFVWGFTAFVTDAVLAAGGWAVPWDEGRRLPVPEDRLGTVPAATPGER
jgi:8-oxo-dGTP pyrophosphatase MutT (NUDIX family)